MENKGAKHILLFGKNYKIKNKSEIQYLIKNSKRNCCEYYNILYLRNNFENDRIAILVSRKVGNAIKRNKIKRIFREIFRLKIKRDPPFYDILIQIQPGIKIQNRLDYEICFRQWIEKAKTN